jgi:calcium/calmodulin-dependent protein kinase I
VVPQTDVEKAYKLGKDLGTGNFAVVKLAVKRDTNEKFAMKIINKALCAGKEDMIETEIAVLKKVKHKYIVGMLEEFDTPDKLYLVLDLVTGGELFDRIVDEVRLMLVCMRVFVCAPMPIVVLSTFFFR